MDVWLEQEWLEYDSDGDAIKDACEQHGYRVLVKSREELRNLSSAEFFKTSISAAFCSTDIAQQFIAPQLIPDTYPAAFQDLYRRHIVACKAGDVTTFPVFIKPRGNNKDFGGRVIHKKDDLPMRATEIYACEVVKMHDEHRVLPGFYKGPVDSIFYRRLDQLIGLDMPPLSVDVAWLPDMKIWGVVEVNPAFGLGLNGVDPLDYVHFVTDAFRKAKSFYRYSLGVKDIMHDVRDTSALQTLLPVPGLRQVVHDYLVSMLVVENHFFQLLARESTEVTTLSFPSYLSWFIMATDQPDVVKWRTECNKIPRPEVRDLVQEIHVWPWWFCYRPGAPCSRPKCFHSARGCICGWPLIYPG